MTRWTEAEARLFKKLSSPVKVQEFLDSIKYNTDHMTRSPREVLRHKRAHCFDGALFAACALERIGYRPLLVDLRSNGEDDDHVIAIFKEMGHWGAVAKSNFTGLRYRDPVYRNIRELALSYFHVYFNLAGVKTLREFSQIYDLNKVSDIDWRQTGDDLGPLGDRLDAIRHYRIMPAALEKLLAPADDRLFRGETMGLEVKGAFKVKGSRL